MEDRDEKKEKRLLRVPTRVPVSIQATLIFAVALVLCGAVVVFGSAVTINRLKNGLAEAARDEARSSADAACGQIRGVVQKSGAVSLADLVNHPEIQRELELLSRDGSIVMAAVLDSNGSVLYQKYCTKTLSDLLPRQTTGTVLPPGQSANWHAIWASATERPPGRVVPVELPITRDGIMIGSMQVGLSLDPNILEIELLSRQIGINLTVMVAVVLAILLMTIVLVYYAFRRQMELQHRTAEAEHLASLGTLASGLAHEIRNPLHAMNLHLSVAVEDLESQDFDRADTTNTIGRVQQQIAHLSEIVTTFLNAAAPPRMEIQEMRLDQLVREVVAFLRPDLEAQHIRVELDLPDEIVLQGDPKALHHVLMNLLINARQALEKVENRILRISAERDRKHWRLYIDDSGPGVPKGEENIIFRSFVSKKCGGTGFGLSIARRIVEAHGGRISVDRAPIGGARFMVELPF